MRIFITGSSGKISSVFTALCRREGHQVVGYDKADGDDILDSAALKKVLEGCDAVAHLAMAMGGQYTPEEVYASGTLGTWNVLQAAESHGVRRIVSYSSVNAMGIFMGEDTPDFLPIDESHPCRPGRPYGIAKYLGEQTCRLFTHRTGIATVCIRPPAVLNDADIARTKAARAENAENEWTPHWEYGAFIHVEDLARATLCALTCPDPGHQVLLVNADDISSAEQPSRELARNILPDTEWRGGDQYQAEPYKALMDTTRARRVLGWEPHYRWRGGS